VVLSYKKEKYASLILYCLEHITGWVSRDCRPGAHLLSFTEYIILLF